METALAQRDCPVELIVVDDGRPTGVADLLADIDDPGMRVLRVAHGGVSRARNAGAAAAAGELVASVDANDVYPPDSTRRLAALLDDGAPAIAYGATAFCDDALRRIWTMPATRQGAVARDVLLGRFPFRVQSMLFPRALLAAVGEWHPGIHRLGGLGLRSRGGRLAPARSDRRSPRGIATIPAGSPRTRRPDGWSAGVVDGYFDRHPDQRGMALERARAGDARRPRRPRRRHSRTRDEPARLPRAGVKDPRAIGGQLMRGVPGRRPLRRRPAGPRRPGVA